MFAYDRRINPFSLVSVNCSNVLFFSLRLFSNTSIRLASVDLEVLFCNSFVSSVNFFFLFISLFLLVCCIFFLSFLIVPLISSHFVFGFASLFILTISAIS